MAILDGKKLAAKILSDLKKQVSEMQKKPVLAIIFAGEDASSAVYIKNKKIACEEVGIIVQEFSFPQNAGEDEIIEQINNLNDDGNTTAIIVQLPLPPKIDRYNIFAEILPEKDADCLNPLNFGSFFQKGEANFPIGPATPVGIIKLLEEYGIALEKKHAVLVGYSDIVGKPLSEMLLARGATVTICHDKTHNLGGYTKQADILISATGVKHLITQDIVKKGAVVVDVGIFRAGKNIFGDVDFENIKAKAAYITPVPGGVGPMTVAVLLENVVRLANLQLERPSEEKESSADKETSSQLAIENEFNNYLSKLGNQHRKIDETRKNISIAETKLKLLKDEKQNIIQEIEFSVEKILLLKIAGWMSSKERHAKKIENIIYRIKGDIEKRLRAVERYNIHLGAQSAGKIDQLKNFKIPTEYDEYYESSRNYFASELISNENELLDLVRKSRNFSLALDGAVQDITNIEERLREWEDWIEERVKNNYEENPEDFELAIINHFEHEKERLAEF